MRVRYLLCQAVLASAILPSAAGAGQNLIADPSFEIPKPRDRWGLVFAKWAGWKYEGDCSFAVGLAARTGKHSCLLIGGAGAKIRAAQLVDVQPGHAGAIKGHCAPSLYFRFFSESVAAFRWV